MRTNDNKLETIFLAIALSIPLLTLSPLLRAQEIKPPKPSIHNMVPKPKQPWERSTVAVASAELSIKKLGITRKDLCKFNPTYYAQACKSLE